MRRHAFTLVELLVVIGIIAVLIALLLPALQSARDAANATRCLANQQQNAMAVAMYHTDSKGWLPPYRLVDRNPFYNEPLYFQYLPWMFHKGNYQIMVCPVEEVFFRGTNANLLRGPYPRLDNGQQTLFFSYALNGRTPKQITPVYGPPAFVPAKSYAAYNPGWGAKVKAPSEHAILLETAEPAILYHSSTPLHFRFQHRKNRMMTVAFADGHAELKERAEVLPGTPWNDIAQWPDGFRSFWFGRADMNGPYYLDY